jgi:hypothetical protein
MLAQYDRRQQGVPPEGAIMASIAADDGAQSGLAAENLGRRRAAGIYGAIITAAILDTAGGHVSTTVLVISVVVTLLVYWIAEEYAEVLGEHTVGGRLPGRAYIRGLLISTWPMVSASYAPLLAVVLATVAGASALTAANVGLVVAIVLLTVHGWLAGRAARLRGWKLAGATSVATGLGLVMILLKDLVLINLH